MSKRTKRPLLVAPVVGLAVLFLGSTAATAQTHDGDSTVTSPSASTDASPDSGQTPAPRTGLLVDIEDYYTSPLRWNAKDWAYFGGTLAAFAVAHHYDTQVRTHFIRQGAKPIGGSTQDLHDAIPTLAAVGGTWLYANLIDSAPGHREVWDMLEAGGLSGVTAYAFKYVAGRQRPDQTDDPNKWRAGGSSFPSFHAAAAFAVGAVLAESGNDDYRWVRRFLGYGVVAGYTAFERLKHNAHWLSDDVAGAAIGGATAHFILERNKERNEAIANGTALSVVPLPGGAMLTFNMEIK
jgi:PAP2 superfamily